METITNSMLQNSYGEIYLQYSLLSIILTGTLLVAPMNLTVQIVSYQILMVSWNYPSSLLAQTMFKVTS